MVQFSSVAQSCPNLCEPIDCSTPGFPACQSITTRACSNSCPSSRWCHPTISSSVIPFSCLQSFPASGSFPMSQFFASGGQSIGALASGSVLPMNIQDWFPLGLTGLISFQSKGLPRVFSNTTVQKHQFWQWSPGLLLFWSPLPRPARQDPPVARHRFLSGLWALLWAASSFIPESWRALWGKNKTRRKWRRC